jgi:hypothetical protein
METTINYNGSEVKITLTAEQIELAKKATQKRTDIIQTFEDALAWKGETLARFNERTKHLTPGKISQERIELFADALRNGKALTIKDKWYCPYFRRSGSGFSYHVYGYDDVFSCVGSRLCVDTAENAIHLGKVMIADYTIYMLEA